MEPLKEWDGHRDDDGLFAVSDFNLLIHTPYSPFSSRERNRGALDWIECLFCLFVSFFLSLQKNKTHLTSRDEL